jgi:hypothetical protein
VIHPQRIVIRRFNVIDQCAVDSPDFSSRFVGATTTGDVAYLVKFRSYEVREGPTFNCPIWQAAYAALAYPNTVAPVKIGDNIIEQICISGEIGWSNPTQEVVKEFEANWPRQKLACLASIGTGYDGSVQIDAENLTGTFDLAMHRVATDRERIAQDIAYRFHGRNMYFRLNVEQGLHKHKKQTNLADTKAHTGNYLCSPGVTESVDKLIDTLLRTTEPSEWPTTTEHFEQTIDAYILDGQEWVDKIQSSAIKAAARELIRILEVIRVCARFYLYNGTRTNATLRMQAGKKRNGSHWPRPSMNIAHCTI